MLKSVAVMAALGIAFLVGSTTATAQSTINLLGSASTLVFTGESSSSQIGFAFGNVCPNSASICKASQGSINGHYDITGTPTITLTLTSMAAGQWSVGQTAPLTFSFCSNADCKGVTNVTYLSGDLQLVDIVQSPGAKTGQFNYTGTENLTMLTGTEASTFGSSGGVLMLNLIFSSKVNLESLLNSDTATIKGVKIGSGTVAPTPEPSSMLLFGSGFLAFGAILRRRLTA
jgi:PEP-CTERM motif